MKRALAPPRRLAGSFRPLRTRARSCAEPSSGAPDPYVQSRSVACSEIPVRSTPKYLSVLAVVMFAMTTLMVSAGTRRSMPSGTVMSRP
jgi:hypothetical protein